VIGDLMIDEYIWGTVDRISPEAPVPVVAVKKETRIPGGAANVVNNLADLDIKVFVSGIIGNDWGGKFLKKYFAQKNVNTDGIILTDDRPTIIKTRIVAHDQQVVRVDKEKIKPILHDHIKQLVDFIKSIINEIDAILLSDYGKGVVIPEVIKNSVKLAHKYDKIVSVDPKVEHFFQYKKVTLLTPNHKEASQATGIKINSQEDVYKAGKYIMQKLNSDYLIITQSKDGMTVFKKNGQAKHIPTHAREVYDVTGAGDTVVATVTAALISGLDIEKSAVLSNLAAGVVVGEVGTTTITTQKLLNAIENE